MEVSVYTDGASRGNPGRASCGFVIYDVITKKLLYKQGTFLGEKTNNQAEYAALILGIKKVKEFTPNKINFFLDSELVVKQLLGVYKVKDQEMKRLHTLVKDSVQGLQVNFSHVLREQNKEADAMANLALDKELKIGETISYSY